MDSELVAKALIKKFTLRKNGLEKAKGLTASERKELERLRDLDYYCKCAVISEAKTLAERCRNIIYMDRKKDL